MRSQSSITVSWTTPTANGADIYQRACNLDRFRLFPLNSSHFPGLSFGAMMALAPHSLKSIVPWTVEPC